MIACLSAFTACAPPVPASAAATSPPPYSREAFGDGWASTGRGCDTDPTLMPSGVGPATEQVQASESLAAGALVNFHVVSGAARARNADASTAKPADGYVLSAVTAGQTANVYRSGRDTQVTGLTPGEQFLSTTPGAATSTQPTGSGQIVQRVGFATAATQLSFARGVPITLA